MAQGDWHRWHSLSISCAERVDARLFAPHLPRESSSMSSADKGCVDPIDDDVVKVYRVSRAGVLSAVRTLYAQYYTCPRCTLQKNPSDAVRYAVARYNGHVVCCQNNCSNIAIRKLSTICCLYYHIQGQNESCSSNCSICLPLPIVII